MLNREIEGERQYEHIEQNGHNSEGMKACSEVPVDPAQST